MRNFIFRVLFLSVFCIIAGCNNLGNHTELTNTQERIGSANQISLSYTSTVPLSKNGNAAFFMMLNNNTTHPLTSISLSISDNDSENIHVEENPCSRIAPSSNCLIKIELSNISTYSGYFTVNVSAIADEGEIYNAKQMVSYSHEAEFNNFFIGKLPDYIFASPNQSISLAIPFKAKAGSKKDFNLLVDSLEKDNLLYTKDIICNNGSSMCTAFITLPLAEENLLKFKINNTKDSEQSLTLTTQIMAVKNNVGYLSTPVSNVIINGTNSKTINLYNLGTGAINIGDIHLSTNSGFVSIVNENCTKKITPAGDSCYITLSISQSLTQSNIDQLNISYNGKNTYINFALIPNDNSVGLILSNSNDFTNAVTAQDNVSIITATNVGTTPLNNLNFTDLTSQQQQLSGKLSYSTQGISNPCTRGQTLNQNASCMIKVTYNPTNSVLAKLRIFANATYLRATDNGTSSRSLSTSSYTDLYVRSDKQILLLGSWTTVSNDRKQTFTCTIGTGAQLNCTQNAQSPLVDGYFEAASFNSFYSTTKQKNYGIVHGYQKGMNCELTESGTLLANTCKTWIPPAPYYGGGTEMHLGSIANIGGTNYLYSSLWNSQDRLKCVIGESGVITDSNGIGKCSNQPNSLNYYYTQKIQTIGNLYAIILRANDGASPQSGYANPEICDIGTNGDLKNCSDSGVGINGPSTNSVNLGLNYARGVSLVNLNNQNYLYFTGNASNYVKFGNGVSYAMKCNVNLSQHLIYNCTNQLTQGVSYLIDLVTFSQSGTNYFCLTSGSGNTIACNKIDSNGNMQAAPWTTNLINLGSPAPEMIYGISKFIQYPSSGLMYSDSGSQAIYNGFTSKMPANIALNTSGASKTACITLNESSGNVFLAKNNICMSESNQRESYLFTLSSNAQQGNKYTVTASVNPPNLALGNYTVQSLGGAAFISGTGGGSGTYDGWNLICSYDASTGLNWNCSYAYQNEPLFNISYTVFGSVSLYPRKAKDGLYPILLPLALNNGWSGAYLANLDPAGTGFKMMDNSKIVNLGTSFASSGFAVMDSALITGFKNYYYAFSLFPAQNVSLTPHPVVVYKLNNDGASIESANLFVPISSSGQIYYYTGWDASITQYKQGIFLGCSGTSYKPNALYVPMIESNNTLSFDVNHFQAPAYNNDNYYSNSATENYLSSVFNWNGADYLVKKVASQGSDATKSYQVICKINQDVNGQYSFDCGSWSSNAKFLTNTSNFNNPAKGKPSLWTNPLNGAKYIYYFLDGGDTNHLITGMYRRKIIPDTNNNPIFDAQEYVPINGMSSNNYTTVSFLNPSGG